MTVQDVVTANIISMLEQGQIPWHKPWASVNENGPYNAVSGKFYSGINAMLLSMAGDRVFLTIKQANEHGGRVRKGAHSFPVVFWKITPEEKDAAGEVTRRKSFILRYYKVFRMQDVEGLDEQWIAKVRALHTPVAKSEPEANAAAEAIVENMPLRPSITWAGDRACYSPARDAVSMPKREQFEQTAELYSTLFHELGHSTGHTSRLNRSDVMELTGFGTETYAREELVAEMTAAYLCQSAGVTTDGSLRNSAAYIQGWLKALKNDAGMIMYAASKAKKAAAFILNENNAEEGK